MEAETIMSFSVAEESHLGQFWFRHSRDHLTAALLIPANERPVYLTLSNHFWLCSCTHKNQLSYHSTVSGDFRVLIWRHFCPFGWKKITAILLDFIDYIPSNNFTTFKTSTRTNLGFSSEENLPHPPLWEVQISLNCDPFWTIHKGTCKYKLPKPYSTIKRPNMWRLWAAREYLPASQLLFLLFLLEHGACKFDSGRTASCNLVAVS